MKALLLSAFIGLTVCTHAQETNESIENTSANFDEIVFFPNPTSELIYIRRGEKIDSYRILNMQGQEVQTGISNAQIISLVDLPIGFYFIELRIGEEKTTRKVEKY